MNEDGRKSRLAGAAVIILLTALAYLPALPGKFVWDDNSWTTDKAGLLRDVAGLRSIWFDPTSLQQYYPLAATSFWIDYHLWGFWPLPYHVENILLHTAAALLFWRLLWRLKVPGAWLAAAIFAVHPVMVESVAWITERKNVLSLVLYLSALLAYGRFAGFWNDGNKLTPIAKISQTRNWINYGLAFVLFSAALLAKATAFSLPAVILLVCWWKRGRIRWRADVLPTLPFFALSIGFCLGTSWLEKNHVGANGPEWNISFGQRCIIAGRVLWFYVGKLLWPAKLCFIYPRWQVNAGSWRQWLFPAGAAGVLIALWFAQSRIGRGPATAAFFFAGTLFPSLGFMNAYFMRFSFVCDHWVYLSSLGLFAVAGACAVRAAERLRTRTKLYAFIVLLLPLLTVLTWRQCKVYADVDTLWRDTLAKNPAAWMAHYNLGYGLQTSGKLTAAMEQYELAIRFNPDCDEALNNLAWLLATLGPAEGRDPARAVTLAEHACVVAGYQNPWYLDTLATAYASAGRLNDAVPTAEKAIELAHAAGQAQRAKGIEARLQLFRDGHMYDPAGEGSPKNP